MKDTTLKAIRWTARILGTGMVLFVLIFAAGSLWEGLNKPTPEYNTYTVILFLLWGAGLAGLIVAWRKEGAGGLISLISFILFNILAATNTTPGSSYTFVLLLFMIPSILYLVYGYLKRNSAR